MESQNASSPQPSPAPAKASVWEDFMDIIYSPAQVFRRRENGNFWIPMLVVTLLLTVLAFANFNIRLPMIDAQVAKQMAQAAKTNPNVTPAQIAAGKAVAHFFARYGAIVLVPIGITVLAFVLWVLAKLFGARVSWASAMVIASFSFVPRVIAEIGVSIQGLLIDPSKLTTLYSTQLGPARFLDPSTMSPLTGALLSQVEVFVLWSLVLVVIGVEVIGKLPRAKAIAFGVVFWIVTMLPALFAALRAPAAG
jgi:Yip1 domain